MYRRLIVLSILMVALGGTTSCKRKHHCYCRVSGEIDTSFMKEYRGYSYKEARQICKVDNNRTTATYTVNCDIAR